MALINSRSSERANRLLGRDDGILHHPAACLESSLCVRDGRELSSESVTSYCDLRSAKS